MATRSAGLHIVAYDVTSTVPGVKHLNINVAVNAVLNATVRGVTKARNFHMGLLVATIELDRYIVYTFLAASPFRLEHL